MGAYPLGCGRDAMNATRAAAPAAHAPRVVANGRFMRQRLTGVQRYAHELTRRLNGQVEILAPPHAIASGGVAGHLWEQFVLPRHLGRRLLWSPANTGPLRVRHQVVTIHDVAALEHPEWFDPAFTRWYAYLWPRLARRVRRVITVSHAAAARIADRLGVPDEKIAVVPNGVDAAFRPAPPPEVEKMRRHFDLPERYLLFVGSTEPRKNLGAVLAAWRLAALRLPGVSLVLAGGISAVFQKVPGVRESTAGPAIPHPVNFSARGVAGTPLPRVRALGYVEERWLPALYSGAAAFVYLSLYEGFGLPVLEAMACGTPVIASNIPAIQELVGGAGGPGGEGGAGGAALTVAPDDPEAAAEAMVRVATDPALSAAMRERGLRRASLYSWDAAAGATAAILEEAAR
ncbi:MAG: glycosyltransferase family 1 protein [Bacillota bacterium]